MTVIQLEYTESTFKQVNGSWKVFPGGSVVKNPPANAGDDGSISGLGKSLGIGNVNLL